MPVWAAFETSALRCSVALRVGSRLLQGDIEAGNAHSGQVLPIFQALCERAGVTVREVQAFGWGAGPGSFTGVRIACAVAQGLAFGCDAPLMGVDSLAARVHEATWFGPSGQGDPPSGPMLVLSDARMGECYFAVYEWRHAGAARSDAPVLCLHTVLQPEVGPLTQALQAFGPWLHHPLARALGDAWPMELPEPVAYLQDRAADVGADPLAHAASSTASTLLLRACREVSPSARGVLAAMALRPAADIAGCFETQPHYVRNKVALTTAERAAQKAMQSPADIAMATGAGA